MARKFIKNGWRYIVTGTACVVPFMGLLYMDYIRGDNIISEQVQVVVLKSTVPEYTIITEDLLGYQMKNVEEVNKIPGYLTDHTAILGKETRHKVLQESILVEDFFEDPDLNLREGEQIVMIPSEWILSCPQTLRRLDQVTFYPVFAKTSDTSTDTLPTGKAVLDTVVMYAKDSANREVVDATKNERMDGTSVLAAIEVKVTSEELQLLQKYVRNDYKFIVSYK